MRSLICLFMLLWVTVTVTLAYVGVKLVPQLVILGLVAVTGVLQGIFWSRRWRRYLVAPLVVLMILAASLVSFTQLALWISPPVTAEGHGVMPIGQTFLGIALGFGFCVLLCWLYLARLEPDPRLEAVWVYVVFLALTSAFVVDLMY